MEYQAFGSDQSPTILLLHGGGLSWWNYRKEAEALQGEYQVILPILDGHAGSGRPFTSIGENAAEVISYIDTHCRGSVLLIGGLSLGGQVLLEMLCQRKDICRYALVESAAVIPSKMTHALISPAFGGSYGLIQNKTFARLQFASLRMDQAFFEDYYRDTCQIRKADMIAFLKASTAYSLKQEIARTAAAVRVFAGEKENRTILRSAEAMCQAIPGSQKHILPGLYHGEFSLNHPEQYVRAIREILSA